METINPIDAKEFLQRTQNILEKDEVGGNLIYGLANNLVKNKYKYGEIEPYYVITNENAYTHIIGLMTPPHNLTVYSCDYNNHSIDLFVNNVIEKNKHIPGINGEKKVVELIKENYIKKTNEKYELEKNLGIYKLEKVNEYNKPLGLFRKVELKDIETIKEFTINFGMDCNEPVKDKVLLEKDILENIKNENYYVYEYNEIICMARKQRPTKNGMSIGPVYTLNKYRNMGYGTAVVSELSKQILSSGKKFCTLFTDLSNPVSNSIYQKIGYKFIGENISYKFI